MIQLIFYFVLYCFFFVFKKTDEFISTEFRDIDVSLDYAGIFYAQFNFQHTHIPTNEILPIAEIINKPIHWTIYLLSTESFPSIVTCTSGNVK